jgi:hypothetical protein
MYVCEQALTVYFTWTVIFVLLCIAQRRATGRDTERIASYSDAKQRGKARHSNLSLRVNTPIVRNRVARFFLLHDTKTGKNVPNEPKMYQMVIKYPKSPQTFPNSHKIYQHFPI